MQYVKLITTVFLFVKTVWRKEGRRENRNGHEGNEGVYFHLLFCCHTLFVISSLDFCCCLLFFFSLFFFSGFLSCSIQ